jgi:hypothetical protein
VHVAHQQLRDGAGPAQIALGHGVLECAGHADQVHPIVLVEALVFHGDERLPNMARQ